MSQAQLTTTQIRRVFSRNYGAANQLSKKLQVTRARISLGLRGVGSQAILAAIRARAVELLDDERKRAA